MPTTAQSSPTQTATALRGALLMIGVMIGATAIIFIKASTEHPFLVASYRLLIAAGVLTPFFIMDLRRSQQTFSWQLIRHSLLPGLALALHFMSWVIGGRLAPVSNASLLVNLLPVALPFFLWLFYREIITRVEVVGTLFALAGVIILTGLDFNASPVTFLGNLVCLGSMLAYAAYMALGRRNRATLSLWLYLVPLYYAAGLVCLITALFFVNPIKTYTMHNLLMILALALLPTVIAHTIINYSLKYFRGQVVGVANLSQPVFASIMGFLFFGEVPTPIFYAAAVLIALGVLTVLLLNRSKQKPA
jgi:drug/metabolite transporter (DMT)-like permease